MKKHEKIYIHEKAPEVYCKSMRKNLAPIDRGFPDLE